MYIVMERLHACIMSVCVKVSGACLVERYLRRSFPRGLSTCSFPNRDRERHMEEPRGPGPFFFFGGANGAKMYVEKYKIKVMKGLNKVLGFRYFRKCDHVRSDVTQFQKC